MTLNQIDQGYEARFDGESSGARTIEPAFTQDLWERAVGRLKGAFDSQVFGAYLKPLRFSSFDGSKNEIRILAPSNLVKNHVQQNYAARILNALREESQREFEVKIEVADAGNTISGNTAGGEKGSVIPPVVVVKKPSSSFVSGLQSGRARQAKPSASPSFFRPGEATGLNPKYTFENFIVGNSNQFCHAAAMRVAERPGHSYNPLFIYGGVGLGKTHILHAIGNSVHARIPKARIAYMSSETFTNELIQSLRNAKMDEFKQRMRSLDVLLIDDIQFMCGKERTQEEFFHTFNTLYDAKCQIVLTSDK
ncbi:MAG: hypothetical protein DCC75_08635, partial [Proteobacteria bacterium]